MAERLARVGDPVRLPTGGYRIAAIDGSTARLAENGPNWRRSPAVAAVRLAHLAWDPTVAVWRPRPDPDPSLADVDQVTAFGAPWD